MQRNIPENKLTFAVHIFWEYALPHSFTWMNLLHITLWMNPFCKHEMSVYMCYRFSSGHYIFEIDCNWKHYDFENNSVCFLNASHCVLRFMRLSKFERKNKQNNFKKMKNFNTFNNFSWLNHFSLTLSYIYSKTL